jgi:hypothetical protein
VLVDVAENSSAFWLPSGDTTVTANQIVSPDGSQNADEFSATSTSTSLMAVQDSFSVSSSVDYVISFFAKKGSVRYVQLFNGTGQVTGNPRTNFDLQDGNVAIQDGGHTSSIEDFGNGWYRCTTKVTTLSTALQMYINGVSTSTASRMHNYQGDGTGNLFVWGQMIESGSYATSYIPTEGSSVTRVADVNSKTSDEGSIIDSAKTIYIEFDELGVSRAERRHIFQLSGASGSTVYGRTESGGTLTIQVLNSSVNQALFQSVSYNTTGNNKLALTISENDVVLYVNGTQAGLDTNASIPTLYKMYVGISDAGTIPFAGGIKDCKLYDTRLTNTELQNLTS